MKKTLGTAVEEALIIRAQMKADGASEAECNASIEELLRDRLFTREWKYLCHLCQDTGLRQLVCRPGDRCDGISTRIDTPGSRPGKYQRLCVTSPEYSHDYSMACQCSLGARFSEKQTPRQDFTEAVKSKPMTRLGRWDK